MEFILSDDDRRLLELADRIVEKWRSIMNIDPIWKIDLVVCLSESMEESLAHINMSQAANYRADIKLDYDLLSLDDSEFLSEIERVLCHELIHLMSEDFARTAMLAAGNDRKLAKELRHKYEQFTSRLQKTLMDLVTREDK
jgi:hypothetical protein